MSWSTSRGSIELRGITSSEEERRLIADALDESIILNQMLEFTHASLMTSGLAHRIDERIRCENQAVIDKYGARARQTPHIDGRTQLSVSRNEVYDLHKGYSYPPPRPILPPNQDEIEVVPWRSRDGVDGRQGGGTYFILGRRVFEGGEPVDAIPEHGFLPEDVMLAGELWDNINQARIDGILPRISMQACQSVVMYGSAWEEFASAI